MPQSHCQEIRHGMRSPLYGESQRKEVGDEHVCPRPIGKVTRPVLSPEYDKSPSSLLVPLRPRFVIIVIVIVVIVIVSVVIGIVAIFVIVIVIVIVVILIVVIFSIDVLIIVMGIVVIVIVSVVIGVVVVIVSVMAVF